MCQVIRISVLFVSSLIFLVLSVHCQSVNDDARMKGSPMVVKAIDEVLKEQTKAIMAIPGVVGTGQGLHEGKPCIKVFIRKKSAELERNIPNNLEGYPVVIEEIGEIKALPDSPK